MNGGGSVKYQLPQHPRHTQLMNGSTDGISLQQQQQLPHPGVMSNKRPFLPTMPLGNNTNNGIGMMNHGGGSLPNFNHLMAGLSDIGGGPIMEVPRKKKAAHNSSSNSMLFSSSTQLKKSTSSVSLDSVDSNITDTALVLHCPFEGCTKSFSRQFNLKSHMKSHNTEKPFQCASCPQAFRRCHDLKRHVRSLHTEVKPFGCKSCCKQFSRMDALRRHVSRPASHCFSLEYATQLKKEDGGEELTMDFNAHGEDY